MRASWMLLITLTACSSKPGIDDGTDDGTADTESADTSPLSCEDYQSTPDIGPAVTVTVRHEGTAPVYFAPHGCGGALSFAITDATNQSVPYLLNAECFPNTCEEFVDASECSVGCNDCVPPYAGRIEAGAVTDVQWPGRWLTQLDLVAECTSADGCPATCVRPDQAPAGTYTIALTVWRTCTGTCDCNPTAEICGLWTGDEQLADPQTFTATVDYPAQTSVDLVITD